MHADAPHGPVPAEAAKPSFLFVVAVSVAIGAFMGAVFLGFEWVVNHGDTFIWDDLFDTADTRWVVVPLAIGLSVAFSLLLRALKQDRIIPIHLSILDEDDDSPPEPTTAWAIAVTLLVGAGSLLAGASLGPEAALVATAMGLGTWVAFRLGSPAAAQLLVLSSVTALLVAFFGSLVPLLVPPLLIYKRTKTVRAGPLVPPTLAGLTAYGVIYLVRGQVDGYGGIPAGTSVHLKDFAIAFALGVCAVGVGLLLRLAIGRLAVVAKAIGARVHWLLAAAIFGAVLGVLYLVGGQTVQFSGSAGTKLLLHDTQYGTAALLGIVLVKVLATAWSLSAGYRGGLVFPSLFAGVALALFVGSFAGGLTGTGLMIGSVAGILVEMTSPAVGVIMLLSLLPADLLPLGLAGAAGAVVPRAVWRRWRPAPTSR